MKWEYFELRDPSLDDLNEQGLHEWELVSVVYYAEGDVFYYTFKRPLAE